MAGSPAPIEGIAFTGVGVVGQMDIADDELDLCGPETLEGPFSLPNAVSRNDAIAVIAQQFVESRGHRRVVFDDKDVGVRGHDTLLLALEKSWGNHQSMATGPR
jgi:hypothetical protein